MHCVGSLGGLPPRIQGAYTPGRGRPSGGFTPGSGGNKWGREGPPCIQGVSGGLPPRIQGVAGRALPRIPGEVYTPSAGGGAGGFTLQGNSLKSKF